jgi:DNA-binding transcriptional ArsR family regulator
MPTPTPTTPTPTTKAREVVDRLSQLGDPVRIRAVRVLEREELAVGELAKVLQIPQSSASRHLKVLSEGGWLVRRPAGPATYYRVVLDDLPGDARAIWTAVRDHAGRDPEMLQDDARLGAVLDERMADSSGFFGRPNWAARKSASPSTRCPASWHSASATRQEAAQGREDHRAPST